MDCVEGFSVVNEEDEIDTRKLVFEQNRKKKKSGGFQSMGLSHVVFKGIIRKGYKVPTPIQRKCIPIILDNKDVVAMARTGSGKTACFLIPLFEKLKVRSAKAGARALILSPTRELALQTLKFTKEIGRFTGLKAAVVLGGDSLENQFSSIHENPDIIIATPGRFMHLCVEMELKLNSVEYVVFDEADRLFELGFAEQIGDILTRLPDNRQTLLFSATLPRLLVEFASAGLTDPVLIRLDVDNKLSDQLKMTFMYCRQDDKLQTLLYLLRNVIPRNQMTVLFCATRYHCEYLHMILDLAGIPNTYIYSELDQTARKINAAKFQMQKVKLLVVTDVAARGIDIPLLDNVVNLHFPPKSKLYIHRVGRVARAGRSGCAYSIVSPDEMAYVLDLHLFLGRPLKICQPTLNDWDGVIGTVPRGVIDEGQESLDYWIKHNSDLENQIKVNNNAYKKYLTCRPPASTESIRRAKALSTDTFGIHPLLSENEGKTDPQREDLMSAMKQYRPKNTIFEINNHSKNPGMIMMRAKRDKHGEFIDNHWKKKVVDIDKKNGTEMETDEGCVLTSQKSPITNNVQNKGCLIKNSFPQPKSEYYVSHVAPDQSTERELVIGNTFGQQASEHVLDLTGDNQTVLQKNKSQMKWDRKKKKFVESGIHNKKKIKTESGVWISASYKTNRYKQWVNKSKVEANQNSDEEDELNHDAKPRGRMFKVLNAKDKKLPLPPKVKCSHRKGPKRELKNVDQIIKERNKKHRRKSFHNRKKHK